MEKYLFDFHWSMVVQVTRVKTGLKRNRHVVNNVLGTSLDYAFLHLQRKLHKNGWVLRKVVSARPYEIAHAFYSMSEGKLLEKEKLHLIQWPPTPTPEQINAVCYIPKP
ncbi:hypothetical protein [Chitinophaga arvensicola]|uniref:Uncharacterized protein n=1 Tax=Chitinophaga arvensicola TaxID=29529 RepID=A0A1I0PQG2_9BACT|nr:hypothetical protein [Chitinophaga arvensicola]SEW16610.1 hypothetical protein SAMN04488122_0914 [Chitinophaga arvensicola]